MGYGCFRPTSAIFQLFQPHKNSYVKYYCLQCCDIPYLLQMMNSNSNSKIVIQEAKVIINILSPVFKIMKTNAPVYILGTLDI
jgi:hypothetical protein